MMTWRKWRVFAIFRQYMSHEILLYDDKTPSSAVISEVSFQWLDKGVLLFFVFQFNFYYLDYNFFCFFILFLLIFLIISFIIYFYIKFGPNFFIVFLSFL
jgi:hypothetical protein